MSSFGFYLVVFFVFATLAVLVSGVVVMARGGKIDKKWSNKLMIARVALQSLAILALGILLITS